MDDALRGLSAIKRNPDLITVTQPGPGLNAKSKPSTFDLALARIDAPPRCTGLGDLRWTFGCVVPTGAAERGVSCFNEPRQSIEPRHLPPEQRGSSSGINRDGHRSGSSPSHRVVGHHNAPRHAGPEDAALQGCYARPQLISGKRQRDQLLGGPVEAVEMAAGLDEFGELGLADREAGAERADPAGLFVE